ncbi:sulfite exporter TauE/SafE family protein [Pigmentiphaga sp. NML080357]|uniref:sulfite exporter TauE/SafE family protein n=1 Tax=Pigmentiphaga sp. NML080357 TaxID=2008675 RepID=UPI001E5EB072|nr:sulfite exporter TauE/SafE family protein [Pigmentiphaga sp. NML080357]
MVAVSWPAAVDTLLSLLPVSLSQFALMFAGVALAYVIFGMAGFGTALVAGPLLAHFVPVATIVPMLALLDFSAAATNVARDARHASLDELKRLVPTMMLGSLAGAAMLLRSRPDALLLMLGLFAVGYGLYSLGGYRPARALPPRAAYPFGIVGGIFSALFGSGGFIYAIYLSGRLQDKTGIRVTQSTLIGLSTFTRAVLFLLAGVYADVGLLATALWLAPAMLLGTWVGRRITLALSRDAFLRLVSLVVLASGGALIVRFFQG